MGLAKELFRAIGRGLPIVALVVIYTLITIALYFFPPVGTIIICVTTLIIASAVVGFARDIFEGD